VNRALVLIAACGSATPMPAPAAAPEPARADAKVDMACVERARDGTLLGGLPAELGAFEVTAAKGGAHLHRDGRQLTDAEAEKLWQQMSADVFAGGGLATASSGHYSIYTCDDAPKNDCFKVQAFICQTDLSTIATRIATAAEHAGVADAMITADIAFVEVRGPTCRDGARCTPAAHYSVKGTYDPAGPRHAETSRGWGACRDDGDCEGAQSNNCMAWYLRGGGEEDLGIIRTRAAFCGCVEQRCRWFTQ
jgi:hypothetical protein